MGAHEALVSVHQGQRLTYAELDARVEDLARGLLALGIERGDRVGIWSSDNLEWVCLQLSTARVGAVLVNVNPASRVPELRHALSTARVQTLFLEPVFRDSQYVEMAAELCPEVRECEPDAFASAALPELRRMVVFDPAANARTERPARGFLTWPELLERGRALPGEAVRRRADALDADDPLNIQFTSGTTGLPKPVVEVAAWVRPRPGEKIRAEDLRAWASGRLAHFKVPRHVWIVEEFPMTITGKLQKSRLREISARWLRSATVPAGGEA